MMAIISEVEAIARCLFGSASARKTQRSHFDRAAMPVQGIRQFFEIVGPAEPEGSAPVFVLSAGWRSGSTLLQRLVSSGEGWLIWGEAYDRSAIVQRMAESLAPFDQGWPRKKFTEQADPKLVSEMWVAQLYPPVEALRDSYRAALTTLFAEPAIRLGAKHWGLKEVRFGLAEALFLKGLFPDAMFLFIRRDLEAAYESYARFSRKMSWYGRWPNRPVFTPYDFGRHWGALSSEFEVAIAETGGILVVYEDLVAGRTDIRAIEQYLGTTIDTSILDHVVGSGKCRNRNRKITRLERLMLKRGRRAGVRSAGWCQTKANQSQ